MLNKEIKAKTNKIIQDLVELKSTMLLEITCTYPHAGCQTRTDL